MKRPLAVFDSGLGGLSVVRCLRDMLPAEDIVYFGDTARVPYGIKSRDTVAGFALELARFLLRFEPKLIVAACNTASALALDALETGLPLPIVGVVEPGAAAAVELADGGPVGVIGTEATIRSDAYAAAIARRAPELEVISRACPLFVPLVEEGRPPSDPVVRAVAEEYLAPLRARRVRVVVLGCTHYPLLRDAVASVMGPNVHIVDSGRETSRAARQALADAANLSPADSPGTIRCYVSDNPTRFQAVGSRFLEQPIASVEHVAPDQYIAALVKPAASQS